MKNLRGINKVRFNVKANESGPCRGDEKVMNNKEIKQLSQEGLEEVKRKFKEIYKKKPSDEIMKILTEDINDKEDKT